MKISSGKIILFGSGETSETGKVIYRHILSKIPEKQNVAILETPAGFQPNSKKVAQDIAGIFKTTLSEFVNKVYIIPARYKDGHYSTNNSSILTPITSSTFIFMGPGSPTYVIKQLKESKAWRMIVDRWQHGATLCFSSAAALAIGVYTLPVYEIYKAGSDLYWKKGLNLFGKVNLPLTLITHWNNTEGGQDLDTRFCYMGEERLNKLRRLLSSDTILLGIDEHTAIVFDFQKWLLTIEGIGRAVFIKGNLKNTYTTGNFYSLDSIKQEKIIVVTLPKSSSKLPMKSLVKEEKISPNNLSNHLKSLFEKRDRLRREKDFKNADEIRKILAKSGYEVRDVKKGQEIYKLSF